MPPYVGMLWTNIIPYVYALAPGHISTGSEMFGSQWSWPRGLLHSDINRPAPKPADHCTENAI